MSTPTMLSIFAFEEAVKNTKIYADIKNKEFQKLVVKRARMHTFYENYQQGMRHGLKYIKSKPSLNRQDYNIIEEIILAGVKYKGYKISPNMTGYVNFDFYIEEAELISGHGESIEDCKKQIDELLND